MASSQVYDSIYATSPRGTLLPPYSPRSAVLSLPHLVRPHMTHHYGCGWGDGSRSGGLIEDPRLRISWELHGDRSQQQQGLGATPHPFKIPSQRLHGCSLDAGLPDNLPPRASRKPSAHVGVKDQDLHILSWPGTGLHVPRHKHWRPQVDSRAEVRGELPPTAQQLISTGSRPTFPTFSITAKM